MALSSCSSSDIDETPDYAKLEASYQKVLNNITGTWKLEAVYYSTIDSPYEKWGWNDYQFDNAYLELGDDGFDEYGREWSISIDYEFTLEENDDVDYYPFFNGAVFLDYDGKHYHMVEIKSDGKLYLYNESTTSYAGEKGFPRNRYIKVK